MSLHWSNGSARPLYLELGPSRRLTWLLVLLHGSTILAWYWSTWAWPWRLCAWLLTGSSFLYLYRLHARPVSRYAIRALYHDAGGWQLRLAAGWRAAELQPAVLVDAGLVLARFRLEGAEPGPCNARGIQWLRVWPRRRYATLVVTADRSDAESVRRLRARLLQCADAA